MQSWRRDECTAPNGSLLHRWCSDGIGFRGIAGRCVRPVFRRKADASHTLTGCVVLRWDRASTKFPKMFVREPGKYCLDRDYTANLIGCIHGCMGEFIDITRQRRGHRFARPHSDGDWSSVRWNQGYWQQHLDPQRPDSGAGPAVSFNAAAPDALPSGAISPDAYEISYERGPMYTTSVYGTGGARIENMNIETTHEPIAAAGANVIVIGNTVRSALTRIRTQHYRFRGSSEQNPSADQRVRTRFRNSRQHD